MLFSIYFQNILSLEMLRRSNLIPGLLKSEMRLFTAANYVVIMTVQKGATYTDMKCLLAP
jgi:hypothetical protein